MQRDGLGYMFYLYFNSLTFALQENGPFSKSCEVAAFPAAASRDEIEQLRVQAAAAAHSYRVARAAELRRSYREARAAAPAPSLGAPSAPREGGRAAAATEAIYQEARRKAINETRFAARMEAFLRAAVAPPTNAQGGSTADDARADLRLIRQKANHAAASRDEVEPLRFQGAEAIRACDTGPKYEQLKRQADKAWNVGRVAPRKPKNLIAASYNIPMCGVKYPNPRRNPLKRRKLE